MIQLRLIVISALAAIVISLYNVRTISWQVKSSNFPGTSHFAKKDDEVDIVSRRRKRFSVDSEVSSPSQPQTNIKSQIKKQSKSNDLLNELNEKDITTSLEDLFGLGNDQLRDLIEDEELPVPREDLISGKEITEEEKDDNKVFQLPDLNEYMKDRSGKESSRREDLSNGNTQQVTKKIDRRDQDEYLRMMQLNPFADADESLFLDEVRGSIRSFITACSDLAFSA